MRRCGLRPLVITVVGKGSRERQVVPVSPDAVVWIRLWLAEGLAAPADQPLPMSAPLWVTLRRPVRPLNYNALRRVLQRANDELGANVTLTIMPTPALCRRRAEVPVQRW
jgi:site-specific recombinase XerC